MRLDPIARRANLLVANVVDAVFPARCAGCGHRGGWVCDECRPKVSLFAPPWCERCGIPNDSRCRCDLLGPHVAMTRSAAVYSGWIRRAVHLVKYENEPARIPCLVETMIPVARGIPSFDAFVPAPLHSSRQRSRGYNQSDLLAVQLGRLMDIPVSRCLVRTRRTDQQVGLNLEQRRENVAGAFAVGWPDAVVGKRLVLVDDVMTTGSTLNACAEALVSAGASWVGTLTFAREI
jgi:competence protein ComFC